MNLEDIEQKVFRYLKQVSNPLVRVDVLLAHLQEDGENTDLGADRLLEFCKHHELFRVLNPTSLAPTGEGRQALEAMGLGEVPCVILDTRVPTEAQINELMANQLLRMKEALELAFREARDGGDVPRMNQIKSALVRADHLMQRLHIFMGKPAQPEPESDPRQN